MLLSTVMIISLLPTAAFASDNQTQTAQTLSANAAQTVADKTAADEAMKTAGEAFKAQMKAKLKTPGETELEALPSRITAVTEKWENAAASSETDYTYNPTDNTLVIHTAVGLAWMAQQMNAGKILDAEVTLDADIDLNGKLWTPIKGFKGTFDGQGHTISNLTINNEVDTAKRETSLGLFRDITGTAETHSFIKNVTFENATVYAPKYPDPTKPDGQRNQVYPEFGFAAGYSDFTDYENIVVTGKLLLYTDGYTAGVVYDSSKNSTRGSSIKNCKVENATAYTTGDFIGMTYNAYNAPVIENCSVSGSFYTGDGFRGIAYYAEYGATIRNCSVIGEVYSGSDIYGLCYEIYGNEYDEGDGNGQNVLSDCTVNLTACTEDEFYGLAYEVENNSLVTDCAVSGTIYADDTFAGLIYDLYGGSVQNCTVTGTVYAYNGAGAVYDADDDTDNGVSLINVNVNLNVRYESTGSKSGGLVCESSDSVKIQSCGVAGAIYEHADVEFGGIVSDQSGNTTIQGCTVSAMLYRGDGACGKFGGIVGDANGDSLTISDCHVTGGLCYASDSSCDIGGLIGEAGSGTVKVSGSNVSCDVISCSEYVSGNFAGLVNADGCDSFQMENCHFTGDLIAKAKEGYLSLSYDAFGGIAGKMGTTEVVIKNCSVTGQIVIDGSDSKHSNSVGRGGGLVGDLGYPHSASMIDCTFDGDATVLGSADYPAEIDTFGMIIGDAQPNGPCVLTGINISGDFSADYANVVDGIGGGIGRCYDGPKVNATNVVVNTNISLTHSGSIEALGGFIGNADEGTVAATGCEYRGDISVEAIDENSVIGALGGFIGDETNDDMQISRCSHTGDITVKNATVENLSGFLANFDASTGSITDSYTFGDITIDGGTLSGGYGVGQWLGKTSDDELTMKNCYSVGDLSINAATSDDSYVGNVCGYAYYDFTLDNYYHAGTLTVNGTGEKPSVGYLTGYADEPCILTNVYYDKENFAASTLNGSSIDLALGDETAPFLTAFVPLITAQMQANRYDSDESYKKLDGSPAVAEPSWDYLNGETYADEIEKKAPLVDALNAGKDGYLNWRVDGDSFRGYPFFGKSYTILYYVDFGNGYELQHIEQFGKTGVTAKEVPVPDQTLYPNSAYEWQDQNGLKFTEKTVLNGDKFVYAQLVSYYTVKYVTNYPDDLAITPSDHDILENNYISGATMTVRSNNTFTVPDGYRFKEWNTAADGSGETVAAFDQKTIENESLVFYAIWEPLPQPTYSVYYVANGGNGDMWDVLEYHSGNIVTVKGNEFVHPEGLEFTGFLEYETETTYQPGDTFEITRDTYLIAQWKAPEPTFSVTYLAGGGEGSMTDDTAYKSGENATVQANAFTNEGYVFAGFVDLDNNHYNGDGTESITMTKDVILVAQWTPVKYTVTYHGNGAAEQDVVDSGYLYNTPVTIRDGEFTFTKENSTFLYWSLTPNGEKAYDAYDVVNIKENIDLYAIWDTVTPDPTYSITYKGNGAAEQDFTDGGYAEGTTAVIKNGSVFTRDGYTFQYWSFSANGEKAYDAYDCVTMDHDITLYAIWSKDNSGGGGSGGGGGGSSTPSSGTVNIIKTDSVDKHTYLPGAKFQIYTISDKFIGTYTTNEDGQITVSDLANGRYYAVEVTPPKGYTLDSSKHEFTISGGKTTVLTLTNERTGVPDMLNGDDHFAYIIGRSDGLVHPDAPITRAEVTTIFFRLLDPTVRDTNLSYTNTFSDVNADLWCNTAISTMTKLGIVHGRTASTFDPNAFITRAEFAAIAARFDKSSVSQLANFSDISGHWAALEISKAAANGWVNGYTDGTFRPNQNITRAEAMALINRVLNRVPETVNDLLPDMVTWPDNMNTSAWCYLDVQEATNSHDYTRKSNGCETWTKLTQVPDWKIYEN